jgi:hypothetical protein
MANACFPPNFADGIAEFSRYIMGHKLKLPNGKFLTGNKSSRPAAKLMFSSRVGIWEASLEIIYSGCRNKYCIILKLCQL